MLAAERLPALPWTWPWCAVDGRPLRPLELLLSRKFSILYLAVIWVLWLGLVPGGKFDCIEFGGRLGCVGGLWPEEIISKPLKFLFSLVVAPWFHHDGGEHIFFVTCFGFMIFVQSFEVREGSVKTFLIFFTSIAFAGILVALAMNMGDMLWPDNEIINQGMGRSWIGGSAGFFGIIGASAHQSNSRWLVILIAVIFETWNYYTHGISTFTSVAHMMSMAYGFLIWGWWTGAWKTKS